MWIPYNMGSMRERQAKVYALGGRFDKEHKRWYIPAGLSLAPFQEYLRPPEPTYIEIDMRYMPAQQKQIRALGGKFMMGSVSAGMCRLARALSRLLSGCLRMIWGWRRG